MSIQIVINISEDLLKQVLAENKDGSENKKLLSIDLQPKKSNLSEVDYSYYKREIFDDEEYNEIYGITD